MDMEESGDRDYTVGRYLAERLLQVGVGHVFAVAGDYNLVLLDELLTRKELRQVYCTNELNCGFSAEGYARAKGAACAVVTFSVGALSAFNALGGAFAEDLPVILVCGAPNSNDFGSDRVVHHSLGNSDLSYQTEMAKHLTCAAVSITSAENAPSLIDSAIREALYRQKPAYIEIACNVAASPCEAPGPISSIALERITNVETLQAAVEAAGSFIQQMQKPVIIVGPKVRCAKAENEVIMLAEALGCAVVVMAAAKSFFPETHPQFAGICWGGIGAEHTRAIVNWADGIICIGTLFNDVATVGWSSLLPDEKCIFADVRSVRFGSFSFTGIDLSVFLSSLSRVVASRKQKFEKIEPAMVPQEMEANVDPKAKLCRAEMMKQIRAIIQDSTCIFAETGEAWFSAIDIPLSTGARFEVQMQWGHIGWSIPASFGYAIGAPNRRVIVLVGDGSFQVTAQEVAQMIRYNVAVTIFLLNNGGYTIEAAIHDGPYNSIKNWDYAGLMNVFDAGEGAGRGFRAETGEQLADAINAAYSNKEGPSVIECILDKSDCSSSLVSWGRLMAKANARQPEQKTTASVEKGNGIITDAPLTARQ